MPLFAQLELLDDPAPRGAALNMAIDEVLLRGVRVPILRLYRWARPAASFGYFTPFAEVSTIAGDRETVRRWTGGGIVFHGEDTTFSLLVPREHPLGRAAAGESYRLIHQAVAEALGVGSLAAASVEKVSSACFENAAESDVLVAGRKVVGGAQRRTAGALLHQGSVQMEVADFGARLAGAIAERIEERALREGELADAEELARSKYATPEWLRRF